MSNPGDDSPNPYAPAPSLAEPSVAIAGVDTKLIKDFRSQILALGVIWLIFGVLVSVIAVALFGGALGGRTQFIGGRGLLVAALMLGFGIGWLVSGFLAVFKSMPGVYTGLVLTYIALLGNGIQLNICGFVIMAVIAIQAHRVIGFASKIRSHGLPLNVKV